MEPRLGYVIEAPPNCPIEADDVQAHDADAECDARPVADARSVCDVGAETGRGQRLIPPRDDLGDDARVPGAAARGDRARDPRAENAGNDQLTPAHPTVQVEIVGHLAQFRRDALRSRDGIEEDVRSE